jgi:hypothetical protein
MQTYHKVHADTTVVVAYCCAVALMMCFGTSLLSREFWSSLTTRIVPVNEVNVMEPTTLLTQEQKDRTLQTIPTVGQVTHFRLVDANVGNTGQVLLDPLLNGATINLQDYPPGQQFSIEALVTTDPGPIGSLRFTNVDGTRRTQYPRYALCGDVGSLFNNCPLLSVVGSNYRITATPFNQTKLTGLAGTPYTITFSVVNTTLMQQREWVVLDPNATITKRNEACFVMVGRRAYLLAGRARRDIDIYDVVTRTWSIGAKPPIQIHHTQCVVADNKIWIVSSWTGGYPMETNTAYIYVRDY